MKMSEIKPAVELKTSAGTIKVYLSNDPDYPGVYIDINDKSAALIEYQEEFDIHKVHVWDEDHDQIDTIAVFNWDSDKETLT
jgi:hypothetical protein